MLLSKPGAGSAVVGAAPGDTYGTHKLNVRRLLDHLDLSVAKQILCDARNTAQRSHIPLVLPAFIRLINNVRTSTELNSAGIGGLAASRSLVKSAFRATLHAPHLHMNTIVLDTHKTIQKLVSRGYTQDMAEGFVDAISESEIVTREYLWSSPSEVVRLMG